MKKINEIYYKHHDVLSENDFISYTRIYKMDLKYWFKKLVLILIGIIGFSLSLIIPFLLIYLTSSIINIKIDERILAVIFIILFIIGIYFLFKFDNKYFDKVQIKVLGNGFIHFNNKGLFFNNNFYNWNEVSFKNDFETINIESIEKEFFISNGYAGELITSPTKIIKIYLNDREVIINNLTETNYHKFIKGILYFYFDKHLGKKFI